MSMDKARAHLRRYDVIYPAADNDHSGVRLTVEELYRASEAQGFVDVTKPA